MAESEFLVTFMLSFSLLLVVISAVQRYTRNFTHKYWDYLGFITNSILFFIIGIPLLTVEKAESIGVTIFLIVVAPFVIMMLSRAMVVYGGSTFLRIFRVRIPLRWQNILTLGVQIY